MAVHVCDWALFSRSPLLKAEQGSLGAYAKSLEPTRMPGTPVSLDRGSAGQPACSYLELPPEAWQHPFSAISRGASVGRPFWISQGLMSRPGWSYSRSVRVVQPSSQPVL